ncbi:MAG: calcium:proton antiporter [Verrucomicrobiota bacterium]
MSPSAPSAPDLWNRFVPPAALAVLGLAYLWPGGWLTGLACAGALIAAVLAAVHHAEAIAHRTGEPFGTLVLALAVTVIEVALIVAMMAGGGATQAALARDTIFSTLMIVGNGVVGLCVLIGSLRHGEPAFRAPGAQAAFSTLIAIATLTLVLPSFTISSPGPTYTGAQLAFAATLSLLLWVAYVAVQTLRHREHFLPAGEPAVFPGTAVPGAPGRAAGGSVALLLAALVAVVGLAKVLSPRIEAGLAAAGAPPAALGVAIALLVLLPETIAAVRAAAANQLQTSLNLSYGSALASIGLTIPAVAVAAVWLRVPLELGIPPKDLVLFLLTVAVSIVTLAAGRTHVLQGLVHLVIFAAFLFLSLVP